MAQKLRNLLVLPDGVARACGRLMSLTEKVFVFETVSSIKGMTLEKEASEDVSSEERQELAGALRHLVSAQSAARGQ